jgi:hypothetical protein
MSSARDSLRFAAASKSVAAVAIAAVVVAACSSGDSGGSAERFCGEVEANKEALTNPQLDFSDDIAPFLQLYVDIGEVAPLAIEKEWNQLVLAYETASTVVPGDADSEQAVLAAIYTSESAAAAVGSWLQDNCAVDIGPVFTIVERPD